ncbi:MAG TPA: phytanoyl-CoA dioxygenase family protein [Gemmatimonas sp.]|nr:phytanoyl-CoA dioxygenase family protein [Gemmatimonas sp.]
MSAHTDADENTMLDRAASSFAADGFASIPALLSSDEVERVLHALESVSLRPRTDIAAVGRGWTKPDGVTRYAPFWDLITHERLLQIVRTLLGPDIRFLQHTDLHVGFSSFNWHRDSVSRSLGVGPDWDEREAPYRIVRVGIYLQSTGGSFRLGMVPGTHRPADERAKAARAIVERKTGWMSHARRLVTGKVPEVPGAVWIPASSGDAVIFDPRVLHTGTPVDGAKYSAFLAFGVPNHHFENHARYYRYTRADLAYEDMPAALVERLAAADLFWPVGPDRVAAATLPGALEQLAMRKVRD